MKMTTEDCVEYIVRELAPKTKLQEWERTQRLKQKREKEDGGGKYIVHGFRNVVTGDLISVYEDHGVLNGVPLEGAVEGMDEVDITGRPRFNWGVFNVNEVI